MSADERPLKPKKYRPSKAHILVRRERVAYKVARGKVAEEIIRELQKDYPEYFYLTKQTVYDDVQFIKEHSAEYIAARFLPDIGHHFEVATRNMEMIIKEAWQRYEQGEKEEHHTMKDLTEGGQMEISTTIKRKSGSEWLRLAGMAAMALVKLSEHGPVTKEAARVMADYRRLKALENNGGLQIVVRPES